MCFFNGGDFSCYENAKIKVGDGGFDCNYDEIMENKLDYILSELPHLIDLNKIVHVVCNKGWHTNDCTRITESTLDIKIWFEGENTYRRFWYFKDELEKGKKEIKHFCDALLETKYMYNWGVGGEK